MTTTDRPTQLVARDRDGAVKATVLDDPRRQAAIAGEVTRWRRAGWIVAREFVGEARPGGAS